jgi:Flp pilus assembly pilin Flp
MLLRIFVIVTGMVSTQVGRLRELREDDSGMTTETAIITGLLAAAALAALGVIGGAIANRAQDSADTIEGFISFF